MGSEVTIDYDPMMSKLIVHASSRDLAISKMINALKSYKILGVKTPRHYMIEILQHNYFKKGRTFTNFIHSNMTDYNDGSDSFLELAAATAAVFSMQESARSRLELSDEEEFSFSPWLELGNWSIGSSING